MDFSGRSASSTLVALVTIVLLAPTSPALAQTAPDIVGLPFAAFASTSKVVDVGTASARVEVTARLTDDTGVLAGPFSVSFFSPTSPQPTHEGRS